MKTRNDLYSKEAAELLRVITMYKTLETKQILRLYPGKENIIINLLAHLTKQNRIYKNPEIERFSANEICDSEIDKGMISAFWVLLDFIKNIEYHSVSDFPVKISFLANGEIYEIIYVDYEQENLINHVINHTINTAICENKTHTAKRIVIVERKDQIKKLQIQNTSGHCIVEPGGAVYYYKLE